MVDYSKFPKAELVKRLEQVEKWLDNSVKEAEESADKEEIKNGDSFNKYAYITGWLEGTINNALKIIRGGD